MPSKQIGGIDNNGIELSMALTDVKIRSAKPDSKQYKLFDGGDLFLLVKPNGSKLWQQKYRFMGKERVYSISPRRT